MLSPKFIKYSHTASQLLLRVKLGQRMEKVFYGKFSVFWTICLFILLCSNNRTTQLNCLVFSTLVCALNSTVRCLVHRCEEFIQFRGNWKLILPLLESSSFSVSSMPVLLGLDFESLFMNKVLVHSRFGLCWDWQNVPTPHGTWQEGCLGVFCVFCCSRSYCYRLHFRGRWILWPPLTTDVRWYGYTDITPPEDPGTILSSAANVANA